MISPWDIYWVMQLDSIGAVFVASAILLSIVAATAYLIAGFAVLDDDSSVASAFAARANKALVAAVVATIFSAFIPSSRTAAAMFVIPAIANNEAIQKEAGDLYQLAKDGLRELVKPERAEKVEK